MNSFINSVYSVTYSIVILGAIMMGMNAVYTIAYNVESSIIFNIIGMTVFFSALIQIALSLQGYRLCLSR